MRTLVAIPCGDFCHTEFVRSLRALRVGGETQFTFAQGSLVYDARNQLCQIAIDGNFDRVLWLDSDMSFRPDLWERLNADMDEGRELVSGLYFTRKRPIKPTVYASIFMDGGGVPHALAYKNWPKDEIFRIAGCGFGAVMCSVDLLRQVREKYRLPFSPELGFGEDLSFCRRAEALGVALWCDPRIPLGHVGQAMFTEEAYLIERGEKK